MLFFSLERNWCNLTLKYENVIFHSAQTEVPYLMDHISCKCPMCVLKDAFFMVPKWNLNRVCSKMFCFPEFPKGLKFFFHNYEPQYDYNLLSRWQFFDGRIKVFILCRYRYIILINDEYCASVCIIQRSVEN